MSYLNDRLISGGARAGKRSQFRLWAMLAVPLAAILFQVYVPLFFEFSSYLAIPLLVTVYLAVMRRSQMHGMLVGASIGLIQDSLSHQPLGVFGISKTLVGYAAASIGMRFDMGHPAIRFGLGFLFYVFHEVCYWVLNLTLLGQKVEVDLPRTFFVALLNAFVTVPLFYFLDKLKESG